MLVGLIATLASGSCTRSAHPVGLQVELLIDNGVLPDIASLEITFDATPGGFAMTQGTYADGKVLVEAKNVDGDADLESVMSFGGGYKFAPAYEFIAAMSNREALTIALTAVARDGDGRQIGSGSKPDARAVPGALRDVTLQVACDRMDCLPTTDGGGDAGSDGGGDGPGTTVPTVDLATVMPSIKVLGARANDHLGVAASCDLDGDGTSDLVLAAPTASDALANMAIGAVYVVFGRDWSTGAPRTTFDLSKGHQDFTLSGGVPGDTLGASVSCADVNGDAIADLLVGAPHADGAAAVAEGGRAYLVLGKPALRGTTIDLAKGGPVDGVFAGATAMDHAGAVVLAADLDGGAAEVMIGAPGQTGSGGRATAGVVHVFKGKASWTATPQTLSLAGATHVTISGRAGFQLPSALGAADLDGNGKPDLLVGASEARRTSVPTGAVYVFAAIDPAGTKAYDLGAMAPGDSQSLTVWGPAAGSGFGAAVAGFDFTKDGRADLLAGAPLTGPAGRPSAGRVYLVQGDTAIFDLAAGSPPERDTGAGQFQVVITGAADGDHLGSALAGTTSGASTTGDLLVGAPEASPSSRVGAGVVYRIKTRAFGKGEDFDLNDVAGVAPQIVVRLLGGAAGDGLGAALVGGRFNAEDPLGDLLVTAPRALGSAANAGVAYAMFGK